MSDGDSSKEITGSGNVMLVCIASVCTASCCGVIPKSSSSIGWYANILISWLTACLKVTNRNCVTLETVNQLVECRKKEDDSCHMSQMRCPSDLGGWGSWHVIKNSITIYLQVFHEYLIHWEDNSNPSLIKKLLTLKLRLHIFYSKRIVTSGVLGNLLKMTIVQWYLGWNLNLEPLVSPVWNLNHCFTSPTHRHGNPNNNGTHYTQFCVEEEINIL